MPPLATDLNDLECLFLRIIFALMRFCLACFFFLWNIVIARGDAVMPHFWRVFLWSFEGPSTLQDLDTQNHSASLITFNAVLSTCQKSGQWQRALSILSFLVTESNTYDLISYNSAIACGEEWEWTIQLLKDLQGNALEANDVTCSAVISACGQSREWELALHLLKESAQNRQLSSGFEWFCDDQT